MSCSHLDLVKLETGGESSRDPVLLVHKTESPWPGRVSFLQALFQNGSKGSDPLEEQEVTDLHAALFTLSDTSRIHALCPGAP